MAENKIRNLRTEHSKEEDEIELQYSDKHIKPGVKDVGGHMLTNNFILGTDTSSKQQALQQQKQYAENKFNNKQMLTSANMDANTGIQSTRDVFFLMDRFKEDNNGQATTDIYQLFTYWHHNYAPSNITSTLNLKTTINEDKTLINYNSKSFNNKTYVNHEKYPNLR